MNKREFVLGSCAALAGGAASASLAETGVQAWARAAPGLRRQCLPDLATGARSVAWQAYLGHDFVAQDGTRLTLQELKPQPGDGALEQFTLRFGAGPGAKLKGGRTQVLAHGSGQSVALYLDRASGTPGRASAYQAHFCLVA